MSYRMLYSERKAYAVMGRWRPVHRALRAVYFPLSRFSLVRRLWGKYRARWPQ